MAIWAWLRDIRLQMGITGLLFSGIWRKGVLLAGYMYSCRGPILSATQSSSHAFSTPSTNILDQNNTNLLNENIFLHLQSHNDTHMQLTMHQWRIECIEAVPLPFD